MNGQSTCRIPRFRALRLRVLDRIGRASGAGRRLPEFFARWRQATAWTGEQGGSLRNAKRYEHPLAGAAGPPATRAQSHRKGEEIRKTAAPHSAGPGRAGTAARRAPSPARGGSDQWVRTQSVGRRPCVRDTEGGRRPSPKGMSATARTCRSPAPARPGRRPADLTPKLRASRAPVGSRSRCRPEATRRPASARHRRARCAWWNSRGHALAPAHGHPCARARRLPWIARTRG